MEKDEGALDEMIAGQIEELAEKSAELELALAEYLANDIEAIKSYAQRHDIPRTEVAALVLRGIEKGLVQYGKVEWNLIVQLLKKTKDELRKYLPFKKEEETGE
jgi:hypothetical protein